MTTSFPRIVADTRVGSRARTLRCDRITQKKVPVTVERVFGMDHGRKKMTSADVAICGNPKCGPIVRSAPPPPLPPPPVSVPPPPPRGMPRSDRDGETAAVLDGAAPEVWHRVNGRRIPIFCVGHGEVRVQGVGVAAPAPPPFLGKTISHRGSRTVGTEECPP